MKKKILIVDDTIDIVELLRKRFRADGYDTAEAFDGEEALRKVEEYRPDLMVLDIMMPKLDGMEVCRRLRRNTSFGHLPVLMLTAKSQIPDKIKGLDIGADDYITKPFDYKEVAARVRSLLAKKTASEELAEREKNNALDQMMDEVSHEVRNPLVVIGGFARRILRNLPESDENRRYLEIILENVVVLERMVTELMELKSASLAFQEPADVNTILREVIELFSRDIREQEIEMVTDFLADPPIMPVDRENITRALFNVIENGIEAMTRPPRRLTVSTALRSDFFEIRIADSGRGIGREKLKSIFDPFFTSKTHGPGLGLTFALKTIQNHNGRIAVESEKAKGSVFTIKLPITAPGGKQ
jgi:two-component system, sensor histidine kinase and response regulator